MLVLAQERLGRSQFEDLDIVEAPAVRRRARAQLVLRLGHRDVQAAFSGSGACQQELQRDGCFAGAWAALEQEAAATREPTVEDVVESRDTRCRPVLDPRALVLYLHVAPFVASRQGVPELTTPVRGRVSALAG